MPCGPQSVASVELVDETGCEKGLTDDDELLGAKGLDCSNLVSRHSFVSQSILKPKGQSRTGSHSPVLALKKSFSPWYSKRHCSKQSF